MWNSSNLEENDAYNQFIAYEFLFFYYFPFYIFVICCLSLFLSFFVTTWAILHSNLYCIRSNRLYNDALVSIVRLDKMLCRNLLNTYIFLLWIFLSHILSIYWFFSHFFSKECICSCGLEKNVKNSMWSFSKQISNVSPSANFKNRLGSYKNTSERMILDLHKYRKSSKK